MNCCFSLWVFHSWWNQIGKDREAEENLIQNDDLKVQKDPLKPVTVSNLDVNNKSESDNYKFNNCLLSILEHQPLPLWYIFPIEMHLVL